MDYKKPKWTKGLVCSKCGRRYYATTNQGHSICPSCLYKKDEGEGEEQWKVKSEASQSHIPK